MSPNTTRNSEEALAYRKMMEQSFRMTPEELFLATYVVHGPMLDQGGGETYSVHHRLTGKYYVCKVLRAGSRTNSLKERIEIFRRANHPNVIRMHEVFQTANKAWLIVERVQGGDLMDAMEMLPVYSERIIAKLFKQILLGVKHLHEQGIVHRDLKIENILCEHPLELRPEATDGSIPLSACSSMSRTSSTSSSHGPSAHSLSLFLPSLLTSTSSELPPPPPSLPADSPLTVKIADFGLSAVCWDWQAGRDKPSKRSRHLSEMWGTTEYFAPEVYEKAYGFQADVWSLGCVLFEMLTGQLAFPNRDLRVPLMDRVFLYGMRKPKRAFELRAEWQQLSSQARSLIKGMLRRDPRRRLDLDACLAHPWIASADREMDALPRDGLAGYDAHLPIIQRRIHDRVVRREHRRNYSSSNDVVYQYFG